MAYVKKADRHKEFQPVENRTGIRQLPDLLAPDEIEAVNKLAHIYVRHLQTYPHSRDIRVGNFQGMYELGISRPEPFVNVLATIVRTDPEHAFQAEKLLVAHGYYTYFGLH